MDELVSGTSSVTFGTAGKGGCLKVYYDGNKPIEEIQKDLEKALKTLNWLRSLGYIKGE